MSQGRFQELREQLDGYGFRPSKKLGQNFLLDVNLTRAIADSLPLDQDSLVLEIGAGAGLLTRELAERAGMVVAVEVDPKLVEFLQDTIPEWGGGPVELVVGDILENGELSPGCVAALREHGVEDRGFVCISNLPYSVAGPTLSALACAHWSPREMVCLCQWEMGQRILAEPGSRDFGGLTALLASCYRGRLLRSVPAEVFRPRPNVRSALVGLSALEGGLLERPASERREFSRFLQAVFGARRKVLRNALGRVSDKDPELVAEAAGLDAGVLGLRPEGLAPDQLLRLHRACLA